MGGEVCYQHGRERGPWYELVSIRQIIAGKEAAGEDATYARELYAAWLKYPEYKAADAENQRAGRYGPLAVVKDSPDAVSKIADGAMIPPANYETNDRPVTIANDAPQAITARRRGRPRDAEASSRSTLWRRQKAAQGMLAL